MFSAAVLIRVKKSSQSVKSDTAILNILLKTLKKHVTIEGMNYLYDVCMCERVRVRRYVCMYVVA